MQTVGRFSFWLNLGFFKNNFQIYLNNLGWIRIRNSENLKLDPVYNHFCSATLRKTEKDKYFLLINCTIFVNVYYMYRYYRRTWLLVCKKPDLFKCALKVLMQVFEVFQNFCRCNFLSIIRIWVMNILEPYPDNFNSYMQPSVQ